MSQMIAQLQAEPAYLMSVVKPVLILMVLGPWAWLVGRLDKDAGYYFIQQTNWGMAHLGAGVFGFGIMLLVPIFWIGWPMGILILGGEAFAYIAFRNKEVPENERWSGMDIVRQVQADREHKAGQRAILESNVKLLDKDEAMMEVPHGSDPRVPAFILFDNLLSFAIPRNADRLEMVVDAEKATFLARIDGIRYPQEAPEKELCIQLFDYLKENAGMDVADRRKKQTGQLGVELEGYGKHELKLTTAGSTRALQLVIEVDPDDRLDIPVDQLGLLPHQLDSLNQLFDDPGKVVLFSSPPHTGTSTAMYAMLHKHDPYTSAVMTYEEKTPFELEGVNHNQFPEGASNEQIQAEFAALLRSDPNVVLLSRVISSDMAQLISKSAEDTRFYIPLPAKDTLASLKLWIKVVGDKREAAESLAAIVSQRLVRKLCQTCRAPYQPDAAAMKKLNMTKDGGHLYKASGKIVIKDAEAPCPECHGLGYRGRVGVYEIMFIDREARSLIASGEGERLRNHLRKQRMVYLQEAALAKVVEGVSDIKEVTRVMSEQQKEKG